MKSLKIIFFISLSVLFCIADAFAASPNKKKANRDTDNWRYEIECAGTGGEGTYLVKVWSYSKKQHIAQEQAKKNAVHGILFKGISGKAGECTAQKPLIKNVNIQQEQEDFFRKFFSDDKGDYMKYAVSTSQVETIRMKKEYRVGVVVSVAKDQLRKDLEAAGMIKGLSSGF